MTTNPFVAILAILNLGACVWYAIKADYWWAYYWFLVANLNFVMMVIAKGGHK